MEKQVQFLGKTASGVFCQGLFGSAGAFEKTAGAPAFADWETGDELRKFIKTISAKDRKENCYALVNALGASEYFGPNINADWFSWNALSHEGEDYGYKTFEKFGHAFQHHKNKDPERAFGIPVLALLNHQMKRVELVVKLSREKAKFEGADGIITRIDSGDFPDVSMGCKVPFDVCRIRSCQHRSKTRDDYCIHMRPPEELRGIYGPNKILPSGEIICVDNLTPKFFDISFVFIGADKTAKVMAKVASKGDQTCIGNVCTLEKTAFKNNDIVSGGKADKKPESSFNPKALKQGTKVEAEHTSSKALAKEIASDHLTEDPKYYDKLKTIHKESAACCDSCGLDKLASGFNVKTSDTKLGEIIKEVPTGSFSLRKLPKLEQSEPDLPVDALKDLPLPDVLGGSAGLGMVLKPHEFQTIVLHRMGESDFAKLLGEKNQVFRQVPDFDDSVSMGDALEDSIKKVLPILKAYINERTAFGQPFKMRVVIARGGGKIPLPTPSPVEHPLLDKISAAYNGYRRSLLMKLSQATEVVESDPQLREAVLGDGLADMFTKNASSEPTLSPDSLSYLMGAYLEDRGLLSTTTVASAVVDSNPHLLTEESA